MLKKKIAGATLALTATAAVAIPALSAAAPDTVELDATLSGDTEVPGPGSEKGKGKSTVFVTPSKKKLCFTLEVKKLDPLVAGHIHKGKEGVAGDVVVPLFEDEAGLDGNGSYEGCVKKLEKKLLKKIIAKPENFYVNIHTEDYPDGAIRGQLAGIEA